ncbi:MAG TPA: response regulator [Bacteroidales bacterium]|nr:response regulator [Bacteroidales bacterium]
MKKKILCIDDSLTALLLLEYALKDAGFECYSAKSVDEAKKILEKLSPDLILLDLSMPQVSGYDFLKMRDELKLGGVKIIVVSAFDSKESIALTESLGAAGFIAKPIKIEQVISRIRSELE